MAQTGAARTVPTVAATMLAAVLLSGCAHPIKLSPDLTKVERVPSSPPRVAASIGYYIPPDVSSVEVTTPGGGGDNVRYYPYTDMEAGFQKMLSNVYTNVEKLTSISDLSSVATHGIQFVVVPSVVTNSGGSGLFTWPPTNFSVDLTNNVRDVTGKLVASPRVLGEGSADTGEKLHDHAIAGKRAMEDALVKMQAAMFELKLHGSTPDIPPQAQQSFSTTGSVSDRLAQLKDLKDRGLISESEYEAKRKAIIDAL